MCECFCGGRLKFCLLSVPYCCCECSSLGCCGYGYLCTWLCWLFGGCDCVVLWCRWIERLGRNSKYSKQYKKAYEQHQEKTSRISRPCDEKGKARACVDNRKDRRKKKQRSSKNKKYKTV